MTILPDAAVEHGHRAGKERHCDTLGYAELASDTALRDRTFSRLRAEWQRTVDTLLAIMGHESLIESNPLLLRSIRNRFPYLDPLSHMQIELLKRYRAPATRMTM